jgi:hypothetical protein
MFPKVMLKKRHFSAWLFRVADALFLTEQQKKVDDFIMRI